MARLFPFRSETTARDGPPRVVDLEGEDADAVFSALSSATARQIYAHIDEEPATASDLADAIDSSIQNVRYHVTKLEDAGLIEVVDTWYSSRGNEMSVYATADGPLIVTGDESVGEQLKSVLSRLVGGIGALVGGSLLVQYGTTRWVAGSGEATAPADPDQPGVYTTEDDRRTDDEHDDAEDMAAEFDDDPDDEQAEDQDAVMDDEPDDSGPIEDVPDADDTPDAETVSPETAEAVLETVPPGLLFFLGGLVVLLAVFAYWYWYRPTY